ncbi:MAG: hypothetical protein ABI658_05340 [Acidimicrobiales bacterium]
MADDLHLAALSDDEFEDVMLYLDQHRCRRPRVLLHRLQSRIQD